MAVNPEASNIQIEDLDPKDRGNLILTLAQNRLVELQEAELSDYQEKYENGRATQYELDQIGDRLNLTKRSENVRYLKRGNYEYLVGSAEGWGDINVSSHMGESPQRAEWWLFGPSARIRSSMATQIAKEIGIVRVGQGISRRPEVVELDSYEIAPPLPPAPHEYQQKAVLKMSEELLVLAGDFAQGGKVSEALAAQSMRDVEALDRTKNLKYSSGFDWQTIQGELDGKPFLCKGTGTHTRDTEYFGGGWGEFPLNNQEASSIWNEIGSVVRNRDLVARSLYDQDQFILEEIGLA